MATTVWGRFGNELARLKQRALVKTVVCFFFNNPQLTHMYAKTQKENLRLAFLNLNHHLVTLTSKNYRDCFLTWWRNLNTPILVSRWKIACGLHGNCLKWIYPINHQLQSGNTTGQVTCRPITCLNPHSCLPGMRPVQKEASRAYCISRSCLIWLPQQQQGLGVW